tara:strand:+ start:6937 stop:7971 length:1035 start_codon:yes stop_codon:yes gene_type:complete
MNTKSEVITIDGNTGEGGGQMLRSALTLSMITRKPLKMINIRKKRTKPGLLRQHLTALKAAQTICNAKVQGAELGATEIIFIPKEINGGDYTFDIGTAGSTSLVAQTVIPALAFADTPSTLAITGGTHTAFAPTYDFLQQSYFPILEKMGLKITSTIERHGFYPAGGGHITITLAPTKGFQAFHCRERGQLKNQKARLLIAHLSQDIARREQAILKEKGWTHVDIDSIKSCHSPGNCIQLSYEFEHITENFTWLAEKGKPAETLVNEVTHEATQFLDSTASIGEHLADQLLLPMALGKGGVFTTTAPSLHTRTNIDVIQQFLDVDIQIKKTNLCWEITIHPSSQ